MARSRIVPAGGTSGQVLAKSSATDHDVGWASGGSTPIGLLYEFDTTVTTGVAGTTEAQGESGPGGTAPAGTLTPTGNIAAQWMASRKLLKFAANASHTGILVRRILAGTLPAAGYVLDIGIGDLVNASLNTYGVIMLGYQQHAGTDFTGIGFRVIDSATNLDLIGVGDDGTSSPYTPTLMGGAGATGFYNVLNDWTRGPVRIVAEFRKLDNQATAQWGVRVLTYSLSGQVPSDVFSRVSHPETGWTTPITFTNWTPDRIGIGLWNTGAAAAAEIHISHLRVFSLGSPVL